MSTALQYWAEETSFLQFKGYFQSFLEALPLGLIWLDQTGAIKKHNQLAKVFLCQRDDLIGCQWREAIAQCLASQANLGYEVLLQNGRRLDITTQAVPSFEKPDVLEQLILLKDVTETRRLQQRLEQEDRFRELGVISATLSHQLKTPLSTALLYANQLHDYDLDEQRRQRASDQVIQQLNYMSRQVNDLLFFVKGDLPVEGSRTIADLVKCVLQTHKADLSTFDFSFICAPDLAIESVQVHFDALVGALSNLLKNACDASEPGGEIQLRVLQCQDDDQRGFVYFDVSDQGSGFHPKARMTFGSKPFTTKSRGSGLGLRFVKTVAQKHGGTLRYIYQQQGSCVRISIPHVIQSEV